MGKCILTGKAAFDFRSREGNLLTTSATISVKTGTQYCIAVVIGEPLKARPQTPLGLLCSLQAVLYPLGNRANIFEKYDHECAGVCENLR